jgi:hypothetical protein
VGVSTSDPGFPRFEQLVVREHPEAEKKGPNRSGQDWTDVNFSGWRSMLEETSPENCVEKLWLN